MELFPCGHYTSSLMYLVLAYYRYIPIENPLEVQESHKSFFEGRDVAGRIYLSTEGINGQMSGSISDAEAYMEWLQKDPRFAKMRFNIHTHHENIFPRMTVKIREQLVALDESVHETEGGIHVSPHEWRKMLEEEDALLIDVRNQYEWEIGHFDNATLPPLEQFRDFPEYAENLKKSVDPNQKVMMYCTGGIRCEIYSKLLKQKGFQNVYQLEGGVINYGLKEGSDHWRGKLFVFDDRLAVSIDGKEASPISKCHHCELATDMYYNCANMDCNELFLCCRSCHERYLGTCCYDCKHHPRRRPYDMKQGNKPFRRKHLLGSETAHRADDSQ
jgi:UPF0176 protein